MSQSPTYEQIQSVVRAFYEKVMAHPQLAHFFERIEDFTEHEKRITDFWYISMGGRPAHPPKIDMMGKHLPLGIKPEHLEIWLALFSETLDQQLPENLSTLWLDKVLIIAERLKQVVINGQPMGVQIKEE